MGSVIMQVLQVWNNDTLPDVFHGCIKTVYDLCCVNGLEYTMVCRRGDLFSDFSNAKIVNYDSFMEGKDIEWWRNILNRYESQADFVRLEYAKTTPDLFYIDTDVELKYIPEFQDNGKPYFGMYWNHINFHVLYVNRNTSFFVKLLDEMQKTHPPFDWLVFMRYFAIHYRKGLPKFNDVNIIPEDCCIQNNFKKRN